MGKYLAQLFATIKLSLLNQQTMMTKQSVKPSAYNMSWRKYRFQSFTELGLVGLEKQFPQFLFPHPTVQALGRKVNEPLLGVVALWEGKAVGLVVVEKHGDHNGLVVCWNVEKNQRGFGLGKKLIKQIEVFAKSQGLLALDLSFRRDTKFYPQITKTLNHFAWRTPEAQLFLYKVEIPIFVQLPVAQKMKLPAEYELFLWDTLAESDKQYVLNRQKKMDWYPKALSPHFDNPNFEKGNSVGLRFRGDVVGWMINYRVGEHVIEYSSLFVSPELQGLARGVPLMVEAAKRQYAMGVKFAIFQVQSKNKAMNMFTKKHMGKSVVSETSRYSSYKAL